MVAESLKYDRGAVALQACRELLRRSPIHSATLIRERIDKGDDYEARHVSSFCVPEHTPYLADDLKRRLIDHGHAPESVAWIRALGRMEFQGDGGYAVEMQFLGTPDEQRIGLTPDPMSEDVALEGWLALARMFVGAKEEFDCRQGAERFSNAVIATPLRPYETFTTDLDLRLVLGQCLGSQADEILDQWVLSDNAILRDLGWRTLEDLRVARLAPRLVERIESGLPEEDLLTALRVLAKSPGRAGLSWLLDHRDKPFVKRMLILCTDKLSDKALALLALRDSIENFGVDWEVLRAIGRSKFQDLKHHIEAKLASKEPFERACAFLALARLDGSDARDEIALSVREAGAHPLERCICSIALLHADPSAYPEIENNLRADLKNKSWLAFNEVKDDILEELRGTGDAAAGRLVAAWEPFYRATPGALNPF